MTGITIAASGLRKRYRTVHALDGFDLEVGTGSIHGLLGPNGAGKSTAVRVLTTLTRADEGSALIDGQDALHSPAAVRERIGLVGQAAAVDEILSGRQNLVLFARLLGMRSADARGRADALLEQFGLAEAAGKPAGKYSGGMRRRLDIAAGLIQRPAVLFLDEPTTGLDPRGRNEVWSAVRALRAEGTTVLLTTQYLDEADQLSDRVSVMESGKVIAEGTPDELKSGLGADLLSIVVHDASRVADAARVLERVIGTAPEVDADQRSLSVVATAPQLPVVIRELDAEGIRLDDVALRRPTLDEVFLSITDSRGTEQA
jgi:ABC-2 type transport system ATP-binding protein